MTRSMHGPNSVIKKGSRRTSSSAAHPLIQRPKRKLNLDCKDLKVLRLSLVTRTLDAPKTTLRGTIIATTET